MSLNSPSADSPPPGDPQVQTTSNNTSFHPSGLVSYESRSTQHPYPDDPTYVIPAVQDLLEAVTRKLNALPSTIAVTQSPRARPIMAAQQQLVFIEGSFGDLAEEFAGYIDNINKVNATSGLQAEIKSLMEDNKKDEILKKLVLGATALSNAPEKEYSAAYNLLIYLVMQSPNTNMFLPKLCDAITKPLTTSPINGPGLQVSVLTILFNFLNTDNEVRYNVFQAILRVVKVGGMFEMLRSQLKFIDGWVELWDVEEDAQRKLYGQIADVAEDAGDNEEAYLWTLKSLRTFNAENHTSEEAQSLSIKALKAAILSPTHLNFHDLTTLTPIQALSESHPVHHELLEIFSEKDLEDYIDFNDEHEGFLEKEGLDHEVLHRKIRLLTLASVCAATNSREVEYKRVAKALQIPIEDVEIWIIDVIRAGLVEGKLSQQRQVFLVHRNTYRVFGEKQWREIATRLDTLKASLLNTREVVRRERILAEEQKARENAEAEKRLAGFTGGMNNARRAPAEQ